MNRRHSRLIPRHDPHLPLPAWSLTLRRTLAPATLCFMALLTSAHAGPAPSTGKSSPVEVTATQPPASQLRFSAGWTWRSLGGVRFEPRSHQSKQSLPFLANVRGTGKNGAQSSLTYKDREYDDGFVYTDAGTESSGDTWNWGYREASQVSGGKLHFHGNGGVNTQKSSTVSSDRPDAWKDDAEDSAPALRLEWLAPLGKGAKVGLAADWSLLQFESNRASSGVLAEQTSLLRQVRVEDAYELQGIVPPTAPYAGSAMGPGPLLTNRPTSRTQTNGAVLDEDRTTFLRSIGNSLDVDLNTISLGPEIEFEIGRLSIQGTAGVALNVVSWDAAHRESLDVSHNGGPAHRLQEWSDHRSSTDVLPGAFLQVSATCFFTDRLFLQAFGRYDWCDQLEGSVGRSDFSIDPSGWSAGIMARVRF